MTRILQGQDAGEAADHEVVQPLVRHAEEQGEADGEDAAHDDRDPEDRQLALLGRRDALGPVLGDVVKAPEGVG